MTWASLFERAADHDVDLPAVRAALAQRRERGDGHERDGNLHEADQRDGDDVADGAGPPEDDG